MNKTIFEKTLQFPTVCVGVGQGKGFKTILVKVCLKKQTCRDWETLAEKEMYTFSAMAHAPGIWGQCLDYIHDNAEKYMMPEERRGLYNRIYAIWREYHLNDMQAGTKKQTTHLSKELRRADQYKLACQVLKCFSIYEDRDYRYGSGWLCKEIPSEIVAEIMAWQDIENLSKWEVDAMRQKIYKEMKK